MPRPKLYIPAHMQTDSLPGDSESRSQFHKAAQVMISCPGEYILSVSHMMRSLYVGHKFHGQTRATTIHVMSGFITCEQITFLDSHCPQLTVFRRPPALYRLLLWTRTIAFSGNVHHFSTWLRPNSTCMMYAFSRLCHDNEVAQWNDPHLLKLSVRSVVQLMKIAQVKAILQLNTAIILRRFSESFERRSAFSLLFL